MRRRQAACASGPGHAECPDRYAPSAQPSHRVATPSGGSSLPWSASSTRTIRWYESPDIQWRGAGGLRLIELTELDPLTADIAPDVLLVGEEPAESVAIEVCSGRCHKVVVHLIADRFSRYWVSSISTQRDRQLKNGSSALLRVTSATMGNAMAARLGMAGMPSTTVEAAARARAATFAQEARIRNRALRESAQSMSADTRSRK